MDSLTFVEWCCIECRRERRTVHGVAILNQCAHGAGCAWGLDKWDGKCVPTGVPSESLFGLSDPLPELPGLTMPELIATRPARRAWRKTA
jgi:hypothetical protein